MSTTNRILFSIKERGRLTRDLWNRFTACLAADNRTIGGALTDFIEQTIREHDARRPSADAPTHPEPTR